MSKDGIPFLFIHRGSAPYLPYILHQAHESNPYSRIILIGDCAACSCGSFVETYDIEDYSEKAKLFSDLYRRNHRSFNSFFFENACFQRTYIMENFCRRHKLEIIWHFDSDVLIFSSLYDIMPEQAFKYAVLLPETVSFSESRSVSPHTACWTLEALTRYNEFLYDCISPGSKFYHELQLFWEKYKQVHSNGGICDMTTLYLFTKYFSQGLLNLSAISKTSRFSYSYQEEIGWHGSSNRIFRSGNHWKLVDQKTNKEWFLWSLHMQGDAKWKIPDFYLGEPFKKQTFYFWFILIFRMKTIIMRKLRNILYRRKK